MAMTKKQKETIKHYVQELGALHSLHHDPEVAHIQADYLVLQALRDLGLGELADAFDKVEEKVGGFYYA